MNVSTWVPSAATLAPSPHAHTKSSSVNAMALLSFAARAVSSASLLLGADRPVRVEPFQHRPNWPSVSR
jgi:hypothetical protein